MNSTPMIFASLLTVGCGTYEPPKPGKHQAPGEPVAEASCAYETPTATRFMTMRCRTAEDMRLTAEQAREAADSLRTRPPEIK
jgi:hypothetical protein